jgi:threonine dehydratase
MPEDAPALKLAATKGYGAEVVTYDRYTGDRVAIAAELAAEKNATVVPPFDHPLIMAGAGTAALELIEDAGPFDAIVTPVGGGGLICGTATIAKALGVERIVGVEPEAGNDWQQSLAAGAIVSIPVPRTIADGLQTTGPGAHTWETGSQLVDEIVTVSDAQLVAAMRFAFERLKLVIEPSGAAAIAAVQAGLVPGRRIGVIVSGGNVDAGRFAELLAA